MTPRPKQAERLEKRLARVAREQGLDQERLRRWVSFLALCGVLERAMQEGVLGSYYLKGGVALELRFAHHARATKDLDLGLEGPRGSRVELLRRALDFGFDEFGFRVKAPMRDMEQVDTVGANVAVTYRTRSWQTVEVDLGPYNRSCDTPSCGPCRTWLARDFARAVSRPCRAGRAEVACLHVAEFGGAITGCTGYFARVDMLENLDYARTAAAARKVFADRDTHAFPPSLVVPAEWRPEMEALAEQLGFADTDAKSIEDRFRAVVTRIVEAGKL